MINPQFSIPLWAKAGTGTTSATIVTWRYNQSPSDHSHWEGTGGGGGGGEITKYLLHCCKHLSHIHFSEITL